MKEEPLREGIKIRRYLFTFCDIIFIYKIRISVSLTVSQDNPYLMFSNDECIYIARNILFFYFIKLSVALHCLSLRI